MCVDMNRDMCVDMNRDMCVDMNRGRLMDRHNDEHTRVRTRARAQGTGVDMCFGMHVYSIGQCIELHLLKQSLMSCG